MSHGKALRRIYEPIITEDVTLSSAEPKVTRRLFISAAVHAYSSLGGEGTLVGLPPPLVVGI